MWEWIGAGAFVIAVTLMYCWHLSMTSYAEGLAYEDTFSGEDREDYLPWHAQPHYRKKLDKFRQIHTQAKLREHEKFHTRARKGPVTHVNYID